MPKMKEILKTVCVLTSLLLLVIACSAQESQPEKPLKNQQIDNIKWVKYPKNPVISEAKKGEWNQWPSDPFVLKDGQKYKMWFGSHSEVTDNTQIGYAESDDGINWKLHPNPVIAVGPKGSYDAQFAEVPTVIKNENNYEMWYSSTKGKENEEAIYQITHATSSDGINWIKDARNPVLKSGDMYGWHGLAITEPTVVKEGDIYKMWFVGQGIDLKDKKSIVTQLGYATSRDGSVWEEYIGNPILELARNDPTNGKVMNSAFFVLYNGKNYELWYFGGDVQDVYAASQDGINWKKYEGEILEKGRSNTWESWIVAAPTIIIENGNYKMWYSGAKIENNKFHFGIGYATNGTV